MAGSFTLGPALDLHSPGTLHKKNESNGATWGHLHQKCFQLTFPFHPRGCFRYNLGTCFSWDFLVPRTPSNISLFGRLRVISSEDFHQMRWWTQLLAQLGFKRWKMSWTVHKVGPGSSYKWSGMGSPYKGPRINRSDCFPWNSPDVFPGHDTIL